MSPTQVDRRPGPCGRGLSAQSGSDDIISHTKIPVGSYQLWMNSSEKQCALSFKHHEHRTSEYDFRRDTVIDTVSHLPTRSWQSLKKP